MLNTTRLHNQSQISYIESTTTNYLFANQCEKVRHFNNLRTSSFNRNKVTRTRVTQHLHANLLFPRHWRKNETYHCPIILLNGDLCFGQLRLPLSISATVTPSRFGFNHKMNVRTEKKVHCFSSKYPFETFWGHCIMNSKNPILNL